MARARTTVEDVIRAFEKEQLPKYQTAEGRPNAEQACYLGVFRILRDLCPDLPAAKFGPLMLRKVRDAMVAKGWCRRYINQQVCRCRFLFKWAISFELAPPSVIEALRCLPPLKPGESAARESKLKVAVPEDHIAKVRERMRPQHRDILDLLLLTGCRPGELLGLKAGDIDCSVAPWRFDMQAHKTKHKGKRRVLFFNATAQAILARYLVDEHGQPLPVGTKLFPVNRQGFSEVIFRACVRCEVPLFTPHQLRHTTATRVVDQLGVEAARNLLGHSGVAMTRHYSLTADAQAIAAVAALG